MAPSPAVGSERFTPGVRRSRRADLRFSTLPVDLFVTLACVTSVLTLLYLSRDTNFFYDEWLAIQEAARSGPVDGLLTPTNGHLSIVAISIYRFLFHTVGLTTYIVYRLVIILLHVTAAVLFYLYARRRIGAAAAVPTVLLLFLGSGWQVMMWAAGMAFVLPVAAGIGMLLALDREDVRGDVYAGVMLAMALGTSGVGLAVAAGAAIEVLRRPRRLSRWAALGTPVIFFLLWYAIYGRYAPALQSESVDLKSAADYMARSAAYGVAGVFQGSIWQGVLGGVILGMSALASFCKKPRSSGRLLALLAIPLSFWLLTSIARTGLGQPESSRYLYPAAFWLLLVLVESIRGWRAPRSTVMLAVAAVAVVLVPQVDLLGRGANGLRGEAAVVRAELGAVELASSDLAPDFAPDLRLMPNVRVAAYLLAVERFGSPADSPQEILGEIELARAGADQVLVKGLGIMAQPTPSPPLLDGCVTISASTGGLFLFEDALPPSGVTIAGNETPVEARLRRFAQGFSMDPLSIVPVAVPHSLATPGDTATRDIPWRLQLSSSAPYQVCSRR